jgi:hypothetical protein
LAEGELLMSAKELAAELKLSLQTLERWRATGPDPACSRLAHETSRHWQEQRGTATSGEEAKIKVDSPVAEPDGSLGMALK